MREPMRPDSEHCDELALAAVPNAVHSAHSLIQHNIRRWRIDGGLGARIARITEELVIHAVATTGATEEASVRTRAFDRLNILVVRLCKYDERVMVEVWDRGDKPPDPRLNQEAVTAGVSDWDYALTVHGLRVIWCVLTPQPPLPRRQTKGNAPSPVRDPSHDTAFLLRVMQGIRQIE